MARIDAVDTSPRMRFNKLDLNLLVALDAMLAERSISKAAERLHLSQSAMSNALARLRDYFDDELLVQVGRKLELTPRAETLKESVRDVLVRVDSAILAQPRLREEFGAPYPLAKFVCLLAIDGRLAVRVSARAVERRFQFPRLI